MTPEARALADAFLSECWAPVREYHQTDAERAAAWGRQQGVNGAGDEPSESSQNVVARLRSGPLTCNNGETTPHKAAPEAMALATPPRGPDPRVSEG